MIYVFHILTIAFIINEILWIINPIGKATDARLFFKLSKENKRKKWDEYSEEYKDILIRKFIVIIPLLIWMFAGLFTFNWILFLIFLALQYLIVGPILKVFRESFIYVITNFINSMIGLLFGLFVIINQFHLKIDIFEIIKNLF